MQKLILAIALALSFSAGAAVAQSSPPVTARVVGHEAHKDQQSRLIINAGSNQGVKASWKAYLVDAKGDRVADGDLTLIRIDKTISIAITKLPAKEARVLTVRLEP